MANAKILIVEDESIIAMHMQRILEMRGYEVSGKMVSGEDAVDFVSRQKPDIILMDIVLDGEMDGIAAVKAIKAMHDIPVIYVTAHSDEMTLNRAKETEPYGYILKPVNQNDLYSSIEIALYRHSAEKKLYEREAKYRSLIESINEIVYSTDENGLITYISPRAEQVMGYPINEMIGMELFGFIHADDLPRVIALSERHRTGYMEPIDCRITSKSGQAIWINASSNPVFVDGRFTGVRGIFSDISERKRNEEHAAMRTNRIQRQQAAMVRLATTGSLFETGFSEAIKTIIEISAEAIEVERTSLWLLQNDGIELFCMDLFVRSTGAHASGEVLAVDKYRRYMHAIETSRAIAAEDASADTIMEEFTADYFNRLRVTSKLDSAIRHKGKLIGVVCFEHTGDKRAWLSDEVAFAGEIADYVVQLYLAKEKRESDLELLKIQGFLNAAVEQSQAGIIIADAPDVKIRVANPAALGIRGEAHVQLTDIPYELHPKHWQIYHPDGTEFKPEELPLTKAVLHGETSSNVDAIIRRQNGETRWTLANASPVRDSGGSIIAGIVVFNDITDLKHIDDALLKSQERLAFAFEAINEGIWDLNLETGEFLFSHLWFSTLGYDRGERTGTLNTWAEYCHPDDLLSLFSGFRKSMEQGVPLEISLRLRTAAGDWRWFMARGKVIVHEGNSMPQRAVGTIVDIHGRKTAEEALRENEERYRAIVEGASVGIVSFSLGGIIHSVNRYFCEMLGFGKDELVNRDYTMFTRGEDIRATMDLFKKVLTEKEPLSLQVKLMRKDGKVLPVRFTLNLIKDSAGKSLCILGIVQRES